MKIATNAAPIFAPCAMMITSVPRMYATAMKGTISSVTDATLLSPPKIINAASTVSTPPVIAGGILNAACMLLAIEFTWLMFPIPNEASIQNSENNTASTVPRPFKPFLLPRPSLR